MADTTPGTQVSPASQDSSQTKNWFSQIGLWGIANALQTDMALRNAAAQKVTGAPIEPIPFGNVNITTSQPASPPPPPTSTGSGLLSTLTHTGIGAGLLGAGALAAKALFPAAAMPVPPVPAPVVQQAAPLAAEEIPLIIDWELKNAGNIQQPPAGQ